MQSQNYLKLLAALTASLAGVSLAHGQARTWLGATDGNWSTAANWNPSGVPNATSSTLTFNAASPNTTIALPPYVVAGNLYLSSYFVFDTAACPAYTFNSGGTDAATRTRNYIFSGQVAVDVKAAVTTTQTFNSDFGSAPRTTPIANFIQTSAASGQLIINGNYTGYLQTPGFTTTLFLGGVNATGYGVFNGIISDGTNGGAVLVARSENGRNATWEINGANTYSGGTDLGKAGQTNGPVILGHKSALGTGEIRLLSGTVASNPTISAKVDLTNKTGAGGTNDAIANALSFDAGAGTALSNRSVTFTVGSNTATITDATGVLVGMRISSDNQVPYRTVITGITPGVAPAATLTLSNTAKIAGTNASTQIAPYSNGGGGTLIVNGAQNIEFAGPVSLTPAQRTTGANANAIFQIDNTGTTTISGVIRQNGGLPLGTADTFGGIGSLVKTGSGPLILSAANTYTGQTTVSAGILRVDGSIAAATIAAPAAPARHVTVGGGGTLAGKGTITPDTVVNGSLRPDVTGSAGGQLTFKGVLELASTAVTTIDFNGAVYTGVKVDSTGSLTLGGTLRASFSNTVYNGSYQLLQYTGSATGAFAAVNVLGASAATLEDPEVDGVWTGAAGAVSYTFTTSTGVLNVAGATPPPAPPAAVTGLTATGGLGQVALAWTPVSGSGVTYIVSEATTPGGPYTILSNSVASPSFTSTGLGSVATYYYVVAAKNNIGTGTSSAEASATTLLAAPVGVAIAGGNKFANVSWSPTNGATSYTVKRSTTSGSGFVDLGTVTSGTTYADTGLTNGTTYFYVVSATGSSQTSPDSAEVSIVPTLSFPGANGAVTTVGGNTFVRLSWTVGADFVSNEVTGFAILRSDTSATDGFVTIGSVPATALTFVDNGTTGGLTGGLVNDTTYYYRVKQVNAAGQGPNQDGIVGTPSAVAPLAPTGLAATGGDASVGLTWTVADGPGLTYTVKRATTAGGPYTDISAGVVATGTYSDTTVTNGVTYYYVVGAVSATTGVSATDSNEASATPVGANLLASWREANFPGSTATTGAGANSADFDGDGLANLVEYGFGTDPKVSNASPVVVVRDVSGVLKLTFPHSADATVVYDIKATNDLVAGFGATAVGSFTGFTSAGTTDYLDTGFPLASNPRRFLRVEVSAP